MLLCSGMARTKKAEAATKAKRKAALQQKIDIFLSLLEEAEAGLASKLTRDDKEKGYYLQLTSGESTWTRYAIYDLLDPSSEYSKPDALLNLWLEVRPVGRALRSFCWPEMSHRYGKNAVWVRRRNAKEPERSVYDQCHAKLETPEEIDDHNALVAAAHPMSNGKVLAKASRTRRAKRRRSSAKKKKQPVPSDKSGLGLPNPKKKVRA